MTVRRAILVIAIAVGSALFSPARAFEGVAINGDHAELKDRLQSGSLDRQALQDVRADLGKLIRAAVREGGEHGPDVAVLMIDIGEAAIREASFLPSAEQRDLTARGISSLRTGIAQLLNWAQGNEEIITQIARAYQVLGQAHLTGHDRLQAKQDLEEGLRFLEDVNAAVELRLSLYPILRSAAASEPERRRITEHEIVLAETATGPDARSRLAEARSQLAEAGSPERPLTVTVLEEARRAVEAHLANDDRKAAHRELTRVFALAKTSADRTLFIARLKPAMFRMFPDPNADPMIHWNDYQHQPLTSYDRIAASFFVEHNLQPYLSGFNDLNIYDYQDQLNIQLVFGRIIADNHGKIPEQDLRDLCRLLPGGPARYEIGLGNAGSGIPAACVGPLGWGGQLSSMKLVGDAISLFEIGLELLPKDRALTPVELELRAGLVLERLQLEADSGSPDTFLSLYELYSNAGVELFRGQQLYKAIIEDDDEAFREIAFVLRDLPESEERRLLTEMLRQKLPLAGPNVAGEVCASVFSAVDIIDRAAFCLSIGRYETVDTKALRAAVASLPIDYTPIMVGDLLSPDRRLWDLLRRSEFSSARHHISRVFAPRGFIQRELSPAEVNFLEKPISVEAYEKDVDRLELLSSSDFDAALIADELARRGRLELAMDWAHIAGIRYRSADSPGTMLLSHLSTTFHEESYRDGWRWLITGHPIHALHSFKWRVPELDQDNTSTAAVGPYEDKRSEFDWGRVIGSGHGAMIASRQLGDETRARDLAVRLLHYVRFALARQSFSRNETQEVILRAARPALEYAATVLTASQSMTARETDAVFQIGQLLNAGGTSGTVMRLGARLAAVSPELADLARRREETRRQWAMLEPTRTEERMALAATVDELDRELQSRFPRYVELAGVSALPIQEIARSMTPDEAMLSYLRTGDSYIVTAVSASRSVSFRLDVPADEVDGLVTAVRRGVQIRGGRLPNFRIDEARALYDAVLKPAESALEGGLPRRLLIVPDGALETIPFSVLVTSTDDRSDNKVEYVADRFIVSRLPSATSLPLLRGGESTITDRQPFLGVGDPALDGSPQDLRGFSPGEVLALRGAADTGRLRALPRLPDTAEELRQLSVMLGAPAESLVLGSQATERNVRTMDLEDYRIVAFATHGLVAGEIGSLREPGLVLTPSDADEAAGYDGYLAASEVAEMRLNADLILLSACNTAAPGASGADGLSGLARSFFFAGTKSLLVSHWAVDSLAASRLTTTMLKQHRDNPGISYAEALGMAMTEMRHAESEELSHPALWGPFEIVGAD
jgi:CHAT domain-containing protein